MAWYQELVLCTLDALGCSAPSIYPPWAEEADKEYPRFQVTATKTKPVVYYDVDAALVRFQQQYRLRLMRSRSCNFKAAAASSIEDCEHKAGVDRILPRWYKTRPKQHAGIAAQAASRAGSAERLVIRAAKVSRPARRVGRTGALVARESCPAQFSLRAERPRAATPLRALAPDQR